MFEDFVPCHKCRYYDAEKSYCSMFLMRKALGCPNGEEEKMSKDEPKLYEACVIDEKGERHVMAYAYGAPWVATALYMDDIKFKTPEEAKEWWEKNYA